MTWALVGLLFLISVVGFLVCIQLADYLVHVSAVVLLIVLSVLFGASVATHRSVVADTPVSESDR